MRFAPRTTTVFLSLLGLSALTAAQGCASKPPAPKTVDPAPSPDATAMSGQPGAQKTLPPAVASSGPCGRAKPGTGAVRAGAVRQSAAVALAEIGSGESRRLIAYVADADEDALRTVEVTKGKEVEIAVTRLQGRPEHVMVLGDGRVAVTLRNDGLVQVLEPAETPDKSLASRCTVDVPTEPIAMAATADDTAMVVTSGWGHALTKIDLATFQPRGSVDLPREPRGVVVEGKRAFVAHLVNARMSVVDLDDAQFRNIDLKLKLPAQSAIPRGAKTREGCQGYALVSAVTDPTINGPAVPPPPVGEVPPPPVAPKGPSGKPPVSPNPGPAIAAPPKKTPKRIFAPMVTVDPGEPARATSGYGDASLGIAAEVASVTVIDPAAEKPLTRAMTALPTRAPSSPVRECTLPRAAAHAGESIFVSCLGIDAVVEMDAKAIDPARSEIRRWRVPAGPTGLAVDETSRSVVVWSQFEHRVTVIPMSEGARIASISVSRGANTAMTPELARGRELFHKAFDTTISRDGRACASCHPDGREDALTWSTPDGPRQTLMLAGRLGREKGFSWTGVNPTIQEHIRHTFQRLEGTGLSDADLQALTAYIKQMEPPKVNVRAMPETKQHLVARGKELFYDAKTACASCHPGGGTDGQPHDVASRAAADRSADFATPSLRFVGGTAPYFHDGRYSTLVQLLEDAEGKMGHTGHLSLEERKALAAYLETL